MITKKKKVHLRFETIFKTIKHQGNNYINVIYLINVQVKYRVV